MGKKVGALLTIGVALAIWFSPVPEGLNPKLGICWQFLWELLLALLYSQLKQVLLP